MEKRSENKVMAMNVEATHKCSSMGSRLRSLVKSAQDGSCRVFCHRFFIVFLLAAVVILSSIIYVVYHYASNIPNICHSKECLRSAATLKQSMNLGVDPCEDFYSYVCGNWADDHPRPAARGSYSWLSERQDKIYRNIRTVLETNITRTDPIPVAKAKTMYKACLNRAAREKHDFKGVIRYMKEFGLPSIPTLLKPSNTSRHGIQFDWISSVANIQRKLGRDVFIGFNMVLDHLNERRIRLNLGRVEMKEAISLKKMMEIFMEVASVVDPNKESDNKKEQFLLLATQLKELYNRLTNRSKSIDENIGYYTIQELQNITDGYIAPGNPFPIWQRYMDILFAELAEAMPTSEGKLQIQDVDLDYLKNLVDVMSQETPMKIELFVWIEVVFFLQENFFDSDDSERSCTKMVNELMDEAIGYAIAHKDFLTMTKPRIEQMLRDVQTEFNQIVLKTDWMDANTKNATLDKSKAMDFVVGFSDWAFNVEQLEQFYQEVSLNHPLENWLNAILFNIENSLRNWRWIENPAWILDTTEVNAVYISSYNTINIPIAIIQYPFYYRGLEALNYGALGTILGHELTHGFDDNGIQHDKYGNRKRWWSTNSLQEFDDRAACFVQQYSRYYVPEAKGFIDGDLTLNENIADNGGLREAFHAYRAYVKRHGPEPLLPGFEEFTHEQLFFISFGNQYCEILPPNAPQEVLQDVHSPFKFRVQGVLSNMEEFSEAFMCPLGSTMNPKKKCRIW